MSSQQTDCDPSSPQLRDGEHLSRFSPYVQRHSAVIYPKPGDIRPRVVAEIDATALVNNATIVKEIAHDEFGCQSIFVLKADAYGHGAVNVARLLKHGEMSSFFAVATLSEALELRAAGFEDEHLIILGPTDRSEWDLCAQHRIEVVCDSPTTADELLEWRPSSHVLSSTPENCLPESPSSSSLPLPPQGAGSPPGDTLEAKRLENPTPAPTEVRRASPTKSGLLEHSVRTNEGCGEKRRSGGDDISGGGACAHAAAELRVHVMLNTGMNRIGLATFDACTETHGRRQPPPQRATAQPEARSKPTHAALGDIFGPLSGTASPSPSTSPLRPHQSSAPASVQEETPLADEDGKEGTDGPHQPEMPESSLREGGSQENEDGGVPPSPEPFELPSGCEDPFGDAGVLVESAVGVVVSLAQASSRPGGGGGVKLEGLCTHMCDASSGSDRYTMRQFERFRGVVEAVREAGVELNCVHVANSETLLRRLLNAERWRAMLVNPKTGFRTQGFCRVGGALYGQRHSHPGLLPVLTLRAQVRFVHRCDRGMTVGYDRSWIAPFPCRIATISCGFADGYSRNNSNFGEVGIRGGLFCVAGKVCMDQLMVCLGPVDDSGSGGGDHDDGAPLFTSQGLSSSAHGGGSVRIDRRGVHRSPSSSLSTKSRLSLLWSPSGPSVQVGDYATLFGHGGPSLRDCAERLGTAQSDLTCGLTRRVARRYVNIPKGAEGVATAGDANAAHVKSEAP